MFGSRVTPECPKCGERNKYKSFGKSHRNDKTYYRCPDCSNVLSKNRYERQHRRAEAKIAEQVASKYDRF